MVPRVKIWKILCHYFLTTVSLHMPFISHVLSNKWMVTHWQVVVLISPILSLGVLVWYFLKMLLYPSKISSEVV